jgi:aspartyl/glutamyl-tRNA(Asn/Gln) amidotransferase C subunit
MNDMETPDIEKLSQLARMRLADDEKTALQKDFGSILTFISQISEAKISHEKKEAGVPHNVLREDMHPHDGGTYTDALLKEAPETKDGYVKVKNIF